MSQNIKDQIPLENVKKFIKCYLYQLKKEGFTLSQENPTVEVFPKRQTLIGLSLINEKNTEIKCMFVDNPRRGNDYLFVSVEEIKREDMLEELGKIYAFRKINLTRAYNAYSINLQRVESLLEDGHYAVALVFLVSAFENITKDLFFLNNELWFPQDVEDFGDDIYEKIGVLIDPDINNDFIDIFYSSVKEINGRKFGIDSTNLDMAKKWKNLRYWEKIYKICKDLGIYNMYSLKKQGNNGEEIGRFEILKEVLEKQAKGMRILNFQKVSGKWGIKKLFETFFNIDLKGFDETFTNIDKYIQKRHKIIHGTLKDEEINLYMVDDFKSMILKVVSYFRDEISIRIREDFFFFT
ncbi:MAG: hypothetical protein HWN80_18625 [Candidatus Lokiarchaeota archaeon]|nr:hypothetical protein [Candidatus Lokiarchaeota archaeon]